MAHEINLFKMILLDYLFYPYSIRIHAIQQKNPGKFLTLEVSLKSGKKYLDLSYLQKAA